MINTSHKTISELLPHVFNYVEPSPTRRVLAELAQLTRELQAPSIDAHPTLISSLTPTPPLRVAPACYKANDYCPRFETSDYCLELILSTDGYEVDRITVLGVIMLEHSCEVLEINHPYWQDLERIIAEIEEESRGLTQIAQVTAQRDAENILTALMASPDPMKALTDLAHLSKKLASSR